MEGTLGVTPTFCSKVMSNSATPLVNKTQSRIHFILKCKLNRMSEFLKGLTIERGQPRLLSVGSAKSAPQVLGAGSGTRAAESRATLGMGVRAVASQSLLGHRDLVGGQGTR